MAGRRKNVTGTATEDQMRSSSKQYAARQEPLIARANVNGPVRVGAGTNRILEDPHRELKRNTQTIFNAMKRKK